VVGEQDGLHSTLEVPDTIQGVLTARIERLSDGPKVLLQTASILGREVSLGLLKAVWEGSASLGPHLAQLIRLEFLYEERGGDEPVYVFKHALTQEVAYGSLLQERQWGLGWRHPARRHRVGPLLPEGQGGWGPRC
jgi:predicted ATPase